MAATRIRALVIGLIQCQFCEISIKLLALFAFHALIVILAIVIKRSIKAFAAKFLGRHDGLFLCLPLRFASPGHFERKARH